MRIGRGRLQKQRRWSDRSVHRSIAHSSMQRCIGAVGLSWLYLAKSNVICTGVPYMYISRRWNVGDSGRCVQSDLLFCFQKDERSADVRNPERRTQLEERTVRKPDERRPARSFASTDRG